MKRYLIVTLLLSWEVAVSQVSETFDDGNFTGGTVWTGSNSSNDFTVAAGQLRSNSTTAGSSFYLSTANTLSVNCVWEFYCNLQFSTSGQNYTDVYIIADQQDFLGSSINGYFVRIGDTEDEISLYKRSGAASTSSKIIDGRNSSLKPSNAIVKVKITRTADSLFTLERDTTAAGDSFFTEGSVVDKQHVTSSHFGIFIKQSTASFFSEALF